MKLITAQQSRDARRELGLSQADVTKALDINRQYLSEFETGFSTRLTTSQLKKLRVFYEEKITEANQNGENIDLSFGDELQTAHPTHIATIQSQPISNAPYRFVPVYIEADQPTVIKTQNAIQDNDARIAVLLQQVVTREDSFFKDGDFSEETKDAFHEVYSLMAANYALWRSLSGWPALGLKPEQSDPQTIRDIVFDAFAEQFEKAGLILPNSNSVEINDEEGEEAV